jgi:hypothetical protein
MSFSINKLLQAMSKGDKNVKEAEGELFNPDIPTPQKDFDEKKMIRDQAFSVLKLPSEPRNGGYFRLDRNEPHIDPRNDAFGMEQSIDPNIIRKRVNPDGAIPSLASAEVTKFSLVPENLTSNDSMGLIKQARKSYVSYKNRFNMPEEKSQKAPQTGVTAPIHPRLITDKPTYLPTDSTMREETQKPFDFPSMGLIKQARQPYYPTPPSPFPNPDYPHPQRHPYPFPDL